MPVFRSCPALLLLGLLAADPARAADSPDRVCLDKTEQRVAVSTHSAVPLAQIVKTRLAQGHRGELVRARLCRRGEGLVYVLTLLGRSGKVVQTTVNAANGEEISGR